MLWPSQGISMPTILLHTQEATISELNSKLNASLLSNAVCLARLQPAVHDVATDLDHALHVALPDYHEATQELQLAVEHYYTQHLHSDAAQQVLDGHDGNHVVRQSYKMPGFSLPIRVTGPPKGPRCSAAQRDAAGSAAAVPRYCHRPPATHCSAGSGELRSYIYKHTYTEYIH